MIPFFVCFIDQLINYLQVTVWFLEKSLHLIWLCFIYLTKLSLIIINLRVFSQTFQKPLITVDHHILF